ncbi:alpha/beta hydrolase [Paenalcaligenes niemegkensis]|nr:alpha/beta hydrolase [Paenalcaligenes niemegkensis]
MLHGISSGAASWSKQLMTQGERYRLLAWDAPGYGGSALLNTSTPTARDYAHSLKQLVTEQKLERFTLVGHSLGALMASAYAALYPEDVQKLVLASVAQGYGLASAEKKQQVYQMRPQMLARLGPDGLAKERGPALLGQPTEANLALVKKSCPGSHSKVSRRRLIYSLMTVSGTIWLRFAVRSK